MQSSNYEVLGAAFGLASYDRRTVKAPAALRKAGLIERLERLEPIGVKIFDSGDLPEPPERPGRDPKLRHLDEVLSFAGEVITKLRAIYAAGRRPILLGGDHSISMASISVAAEQLRATFGPKAELGLLWVDAHADINTPETTPTGNIHGMPIAHLLGRGQPDLVNLCGFAPKLYPHNVVYIGLRDVDPGEREAIRELGITAYSMKDVDLLGIGEVCRRAYEQLSRATRFVVSFDLDVCDPWIAPGVGTPVRGGLSFRESHLIMELAAEQQDRLMALEVVEYNPELDINSLTGEIAIGLIESALGKTIL